MKPLHTVTTINDLLTGGGNIVTAPYSTQTASGSPDFSALTMDGAGIPVRKASGTPAFAALTMDGISIRGSVARGTPAFAALGMDGTGFLGYKVNGGLDMAALTMDGAGKRTVPGAGDWDMAPLETDGDGVRVVTMDGAWNHAALALDSTVFRTVPAEAAVTLIALAMDGVSKRIVYVDMAGGNSLVSGPSLDDLVSSPSLDSLVSQKIPITPAALTTALSWERTVSGTGDLEPVALVIDGGENFLFLCKGWLTTAALESVGVWARTITGTAEIVPDGLALDGISKRNLAVTGAWTHAATRADSGGTVLRLRTATGGLDLALVGLDGLAADTGPGSYSVAGTIPLVVPALGGIGRILRRWDASGGLSFALVGLSGTGKRAIPANGPLTFAASGLHSHGKRRVPSTAALSMPPTTVAAAARRNWSAAGDWAWAALTLDGDTAWVEAIRANGGLVLAPIETGATMVRTVSISSALQIAGLTASLAEHRTVSAEGGVTLADIAALGGTDLLAIAGYQWFRVAGIKQVPGTHCKVLELLPVRRPINK